MRVSAKQKPLLLTKQGVKEGGEVKGGPRREERPDRKLPHHSARPGRRGRQGHGVWGAEGPAGGVGGAVRTRGPTLLRRMLILLPLALHLREAMPPTPGTSPARLLQLQCTFASLWGGTRSQWHRRGMAGAPSPSGLEPGPRGLSSAWAQLLSLR